MTTSHEHDPPPQDRKVPEVPAAQELTARQLELVAGGGVYNCGNGNFMGTNRGIWMKR